MPSNATGKITFDSNSIIEQNEKDFFCQKLPERDLARFFSKLYLIQTRTSIEASWEPDQR